MNTLTLSPLASRLEELLKEPTYFWQVIAALSDQTYRTTLVAWAELRENRELDRDEFGRYWLK